MPVVKSRTDRTEISAASSAVPLHLTPWNAHIPYAHQGVVALKCSAAADSEQAFIANLPRREQALQRWRGL